MWVVMMGFRQVDCAAVCLERDRGWVWYWGRNRR